MKNTRFFYSICYPDREEIEFIEQPIDQEALLSLFQNFDWEKELSKPMEHYSPSLDFVGASDKHRLILSGLGEGQLEAFMAMYIVPHDEACPDVFDDRNYFRADTYSAEVSLSTADQLIGFFLAGNDLPIKNTLAPKQKARITNPWERAIMREIEQDGGVVRNDDFWNEPEWTLAKIGQRILGYGMFLLFIFLLGLSIWEMNFRGIFFMVLGMLGVGVYIKSDLSILLEKRRRRRKGNRD